MSSKQLLILAGLGLSSLVGCQKVDTNPASSSPTTPASAKSLDRVKVATASRKTMTLVTEQPGRVLPYEQTPIYSKLAGYVESVQVDIGDRVTKGQTLIKLKVPEYQDQVQQKKSLLVAADAKIKQAEASLVAAEAAATSARAAVEEALARVKQAESQFEQIGSEKRRVEQLVERGSVTAKLGDEVLSQFRSAEANRQEAHAMVQSAKARSDEALAKTHTAQADIEAAKANRQVVEAELAQAETMLSYATLIAPFDGVVLKRNVDSGHFVQPASSPGSPSLLSVANTNRLRVFVDVPETEASYLDAGYADEAAGDLATIRSPSLKDQTITARVTRQGSQLEPDNRSLTAEIDLEGQGARLMPGAYVTVSIVLEQREQALVLPTTAIVRSGAETSVRMVVDKKIVIRPVKLGLRVGDEVQILEGLDGSESVVQLRAANLQEGQEVEVLR